MTTRTDQDDFVARLSEHRRLVQHVANAYGATAADREDLAQEILAQAWKAFPGYDPTRRFSTWMYRIALNVAISHARREGRRGPPPAPIDPGRDLVAGDRGAAPEADDRIARLQRLIAELGPLDRALLLMHLDDRSHREIGEVLGITESNVSTKLHRLKQRLRRDVADAAC